MVDLEALGYLVRDAREARRNPLANHHGADRVRGLPARAARARQVWHASWLGEHHPGGAAFDHDHPGPLAVTEQSPAAAPE